MDLHCAKLFSVVGLNLGPHACQASTLPLSDIPSPEIFTVRHLCLYEACILVLRTFLITGEQDNSGKLKQEIENVKKLLKLKEVF